MSNFKSGALYKNLVHVLPEFALDPFSEAPTLNVLRLCKAAEMSPEGVYKWLRSSKLTPQKASLLVKIANRPDNLKLLETLGRVPPTVQDFTQFVFDA